MNVPFTNMALQYELIRPEVDKAIAQVFSEGIFIGGTPVKEFEEKFARQSGIKNCVALGNGTDGLFLSLKALGIGPGDEVITPAWSWISTAEVITLAGAKVVFADVDSEYFTVTAQAVKAKISERTKAVIVVHLYGQMAEMDELVTLCKKNKIKLIEDCSQAHFSKLGNNLAGTLGDCGVFSLYPTKNLGAYGDAGCLITNNDVLAEQVRRFANHGGLSKDDHLFEGFNSRMDTLQAAILNVKLNYLAEWNKQRIDHAKTYYTELANVSAIKLPVSRKTAWHTFHLFVILAERREELKEFLAQKGIQTLIHYPKALPFEPAYQYLLCQESDFPVSAKLQNQVLSLPVSPEHTTEQIMYVCQMIKLFYQNR